MRRSLLLLPILALAACATPAQRIASKLGEYGVPAQQAQCMGDKLQARLSLAQISRLNDLGRLNGDRIDRMNIAEIARQLNGPDDAALAAELIRAGIGCAF